MDTTNAVEAPRSPFMDTRQSAAYLGGLSPRTLEKYRMTGEGPAHYVLGGRRCFYKREDLDEWAETRRRLSTSDMG